MSLRESPNTCLLLRATRRELMLATTTSLSAAPCDNFVALHDNTGTDIDALELVVPCDNLGSTYSGRVLFFPFLPREVVALCNNLVPPCDNEVEHGRSPIPDSGEGTAPKPHARP